ncbi:MAG: N-acetylmuramoyl-L-alanine amidase [Firmicutes bacterium]|nr:N-acetylmuramoyl-L-alanine amidase [Bacillota bacterium]
MEKDITVDVVERLAPWLAVAGLEVVRTREGDENVTVSERCRRAQAGRPQILISIHCGSSAGFTEHGLVVASAFRSQQSRFLAGAIHTYLAYLGLHDGGIKEDVLNSFRDLEAISATVFLGYLTNPGDEALLAQAKFREHSARLIADSLCRYFGIPGPVSALKKLGMSNGLMYSGQNTDTPRPSGRQGDEGMAPGEIAGWTQWYNPVSLLEMARLGYMIANSLGVLAPEAGVELKIRQGERAAGVMRLPSRVEPLPKAAESKKQGYKEPYSKELVTQDDQGIERETTAILDQNIATPVLPARQREMEHGRGKMKKALISLFRGGRKVQG